MNDRSTAIIFDFDGTIIDTEWSEFVTVRQEFRRHGLDYKLDDFRLKVGRADHRHWSDELQDELGPRDDIEEIRARRRRAHTDMIAGTDLRLGVLDVLDGADRRGRAVAVASSSPLRWVERHLTERDIIDRFSVLATRDDVTNAKPWPDVFLVAAERLGVDPSACVVIEDSYNGVAAAKAAGMACVVVPNRVTAASDFSAADAVLDTLIDFPFERFGL